MSEYTLVTLVVLLLSLVATLMAIQAAYLALRSCAKALEILKASAERLGIRSDSKTPLLTPGVYSTDKEDADGTDTLPRHR